MISAIVTDIEGTTSSIEFVHTTLFPYARRELDGFVRTHAAEPAVRSCLADVDALVGRALSLDEAIDTMTGWIDADRKAPPLKLLQGMIWRGGYRSGALRGHVYDDVPPTLQRWHAAGKRLFVYSSGSEEAQRLLFEHSIAGDLTRFFTGYFDTRVGAKAESSSYRQIRDALGLDAGAILFLSDVEAELDAARDSGMITCQLIRAADCVPAPRHVHARDFDEVDQRLGTPHQRPAPT